MLARDKGSTSVPGVVLGVLAEHDRWLAQNKWRKPIPIVANVISLVAKGLSGGDAGQSPGTGVLPRQTLIWLLGNRAQVQLDRCGNGGSAFPRDNMPDVVRCLHHTAGTGALQCFLVGLARVAKHEP